MRDWHGVANPFFWQVRPLGKKGKQDKLPSTNTAASWRRHGRRDTASGMKDVPSPGRTGADHTQTLAAGATGASRWVSMRWSRRRVCGGSLSTRHPPRSNSSPRLPGNGLSRRVCTTDWVTAALDRVLEMASPRFPLRRPWGRVAWRGCIKNSPRGQP